MTQAATNANEPTFTGLAAAIWHGWDRFWFRPADPTTLGLIRLLAGLAVLYVHLNYSGDLAELIGPNAWMDADLMRQMRTESPVISQPWNWADPPPNLPEPTTRLQREEIEQFRERWDIDPRLPYPRGRPVWSIWFHVMEPTAILAVHLGCLAIFALFTVGLWTRLTSVLAWIAALSYIQRTTATVYGLDAVVNVTLLYLTIGPSGAALSVDRWLQLRAARLRQAPPPPLVPSVTANFAIRLLQIQFCVIYLASGLAKLQGSMWWNGTALWYCLDNPEYAPLHLQKYVDLLTLLVQHRWLWEILMTAGAVYTVGLEIALPFLIWLRPLRWLMIVLSVALHTGIAIVMGLHAFGLMMLCLLLSFVPSDAVRGALAAYFPGVGPDNHRA